MEDGWKFSCIHKWGILKEEDGRTGREIVFWKYNFLEFSETKGRHESSTGAFNTDQDTGKKIHILTNFTESVELQ